VPFPAASPDFRTGRFLMAFFWGLICAAVAGAPVLSGYTHSTAAGFIYLFFAPICHQLPARSFFVAGHPMAVCHRCTGIYAGLFLSSLIRFDNDPPLGSLISLRLFVLSGSAPILLDAVLPYAGLWTNTPLSRTSTGLIFGVVLGCLLVPGISEFLHEAPWRRLPVASHIKGDIS